MARQVDGRMMAIQGLVFVGSWAKALQSAQDGPGGL